MTVSEYHDGSRILRVGDVVRVRGVRGDFAITGFDLDAGTFDCYGGSGERRMWRTFRLDRLGAKNREATRRRQETIA